MIAQPVSMGSALSVPRLVLQIDCLDIHCILNTLHTEDATCVLQASMDANSAQRWSACFAFKFSHVDAMTSNMSNIGSLSDTLWTYVYSGLMMLMCNTASIEVACHCLPLLVIDPFVLMRPPSLPPWTTYQTHGQAGQTIETNRPPFGQVHGAYPSKCQSQNLKRLHRLHSQPLYNSHKVQLGLIEGCSALGITWTGSIILDPYATEK